MSNIVNIIYFILILSVIIIVHELGHLIAAKRFGVYCKEFSIGMGPGEKGMYHARKPVSHTVRTFAPHRCNRCADLRACHCLPGWLHADHRQ